MATLAEIEQSSKDWLTIAEIAPVLGSDPQAIRAQAHRDRAALGFPIIMVGNHIKIPRVGFLNFFKGAQGK